MRMWCYVKAAFWASPDLPSLGRFPINAAVLVGLVILGFGQAGFWLLAVGLEAAYLVMMATNPRFQRLVEAGERHPDAAARERRPPPAGSRRDRQRSPAARGAGHAGARRGSRHRRPRDDLLRRGAREPALRGQLRLRWGQRGGAGSGPLRSAGRTEGARGAADASPRTRPVWIPERDWRSRLRNARTPRAGGRWRRGP